MGVSFDSIADNKAFADKYDFNFSLLCDTERTMGLAYGACDDVRAKTAQRVGVVIGPDGFVREYSAKVNSRTYPAEVWERL